MNARMLAMVLLAGACSTAPEYFRPTENVNAQGRRGEPAAQYDIKGTAGTLGQVNVWSQGRTHGGVRIGMEVRNASTEPITVDLTDAQLLGVEGGGALTWSSSSSPQLTIAPQDVRDVDLVFEKPKHAGNFQLRWSLMAEGKRVTHFTPFVEDVMREQIAYAPAYGYYDPFAYDPFFYPRYPIYYSAYGYYPFAGYR